MLTLEVRDIRREDVSVHLLELLLGEDLEIQLGLLVLGGGGSGSDSLRVLLDRVAVSVQLRLDLGDLLVVLAAGSDKASVKDLGIVQGSGGERGLTRCTGARALRA